MISLTYAGGVALAAFAGVLAAPIYSVNPNMGSNFIIVVFAVVVIGGMGSILGSIVTGFGLGIVEGLTKVYLPAGLGDGDLRGDGDRAAGAAGRAVRKGGVSMSVTTTAVAPAPPVPHARLQRRRRRSRSWSCWR